MPVTAYESIKRKKRVQELLVQKKTLSEIDKMLGFSDGTASAIMNPKRNRSSDKFIQYFKE